MSRHTVFWILSRTLNPKKVCGTGGSSRWCAAGFAAAAMELRLSHFLYIEAGRRKQHLEQAIALGDLLVGQRLRVVGARRDLRRHRLLRCALQHVSSKMSGNLCHVEAARHQLHSDMGFHLLHPPERSILQSADHVEKRKTYLGAHGGSRCTTRRLCTSCTSCFVEK